LQITPEIKEMCYKAFSLQCIAVFCKFMGIHTGKQKQTESFWSTNLEKNGEKTDEKKQTSEDW